MSSVRGGVITGLPGIKKTFRTLLSLLEFSDRPAVFSVPLRKLRDEIVEKRMWMPPLSNYRDRSVVVRAHDETCPDLKKRLENGMKYWRSLSDHLRKHREGKEECRWKSEVKKIMSSLKNNKVIITTHGIGILIFLINWVLKKNTIFIFDEGDELFTSVNDPIHLGDLEPLKEISRTRYNKLMKMLITPTRFKSPRSALFLHPKILYSLIQNSFFITATFPPSISEFFNWYENKTIEQYRLRGEMEEDTIIILDKQLNWIERKKWKRILYPQILEIVNESVKKFGTIGIISRNYEQNLELVKLFQSSGYTVWSDRLHMGTQDEGKYMDSDVVIITTRGKGYRGVNLFSKRTGGDFPVIIGFYQSKGDDIVHPMWRTMFADDPDDPYSEMSNFIRDLVMAKNIQSLFRFNRYRRRKHVLILLDKRWITAMRTYVLFYYKKSNEITINMEDLSRSAIPIIKSFNPNP